MHVWSINPKAPQWFPTLREVRAELQDAIDQEGRSFQESDGVVRDGNAIVRIRCLQAALELLAKRAVTNGVATLPRRKRG